MRPENPVYFYGKGSFKDVRIIWKWNRTYGKGAGFFVGQTEYNT